MVAMSNASALRRQGKMAFAPLRGSRAVWAAQIGLALLFMFAGGFKLVLPAADITKGVPYPAEFMRFIGVAEALGGLALVLPAAALIARRLVPLAATGLVIIMIGATVTTVVEASAAPALFPACVGVIAAAVGYARRGWLKA